MACVTIVPDALPASVFRGLADAVLRVRKETCDALRGTLWLAHSAAPGTLIDLAIAHLRDLADPRRDCAGAEWWLAVRDLDEEMPLHFDRDVGRHAATGETVFPHLASIFYFSEVGLPTTILNHVMTVGGRGMAADGESRGELVTPRCNQFAMFSGRYLHGVLGKVNGTDRASGIEPAHRVTLLINWWRQRPHPASCRAFTAAHPLAEWLAMPSAEARAAR